MSAGVALMEPNLIAALALALACLVTAVQIQVRVVEEPHLARTHGEQYLRYAISAARFLPGIGPMRVTHPRGAESR